MNRNVALSTLASLAIKFVRVVQQVIWVPLFLAAFGADGYGEWLTLFGLAGYLSMADVGIQHFWLNKLTGAHVRGETDVYRQLFRTGMLLLLLGTGIAALVSMVFARLDGPTRLLGLETISPITASNVFLILSGATLISIFANMLRGVFRTVGEYPKVVFFEMWRETLVLFAVAFGLLVGFEQRSLACVYAAIAVVVFLWVHRSVRMRFSHLLDLRVLRTDCRTLLGLVTGGSINLASVLANLLILQGTLVLTNWSLGAAAVTMIATSRTLTNMVRQLAGSVYLASLPEFSRLEAAGSFPQMARLLRRSIAVGLTISGISVIALVGLGPWVYRIWTGSRFDGVEPLLYLFASSVMVDALRMPFHEFLMGCNRISRVAIANITFAVASLVTMWMLFPYLGVWSVPIATMACGIAVHMPLMLAATGRVLGWRGWQDSSARAAGSIAVIAGLSVFVVLFDRSLGSPLVTAVCVATAASIVVLFSWCCLFTVGDRDAIRNVIKGRVRFR